MSRGSKQERGTQTMTPKQNDTNPMTDTLLDSELDTVAGGTLPPVITYTDKGATVGSFKRLGFVDVCDSGTALK